MKKFFFYLMFFLSATGLKAQGLGLQELIAKARENQPNLAQLQLIEEATTLKLKGLSANYLPQTSVGGQASWQSVVTSINVPVPGIEINPPPKDQYKFTFDVQQNVWDGGLTSAGKNLELANARLQKSQVEVELQKVDQMVSQYYFMVLLSQRNLQTLEQSMTELNERLERMQVAYENGLISKGDFLSLKAKKMEALQNEEGLQASKDIAHKALEMLTGEELPADFAAQLKGFEALDMQNNLNPQILALDAQQFAMGASESLIKAKYNPKLGLFATAGLGRPGLNFLAQGFNPYFIGGVQLKIPLSQFYAKTRSSEVQEAKVNALKVQKQKEAFLLSNKIQLNEQQERIASLQKQIVQDRDLIAIREEILQSTKEKLDNGLITSADYLTELNNLEQSRTQLAIHEIQILQGKQKIKLLLGQ
ncbi:TolC family protein [Marinilongibacter aquaticus]|uniref:TolC family protein n=1 Tax=Marinilongibacter aquaticus TaxID=2975157 RepID=UPI0021BDA5A1|nr:TolC family protein [Marinilongibacter aquaticus]UBM60894.1 TolC family protein [Marinilongibacter aquaticus]